MDHSANVSMEQSWKSIGRNLLRPNVGGLDRAIRMLVGSILLAAGILLRIHGVSHALTVGIVGLVMLVMSFIRFCPLYVPFGFSTAGKGTGAETR